MRLFELRYANLNTHRKYRSTKSISLPPRFSRSETAAGSVPLRGLPRDQGVRQVPGGSSRVLK